MQSSNTGAGACALPMAIRHHFPKAAIDAVDIDAEALDLAQCFFETQEDAHLMLHNEDGVKFLTKHGVTSQVATHNLGLV
jgi:spermidine synthase